MRNSFRVMISQVKRWFAVAEGARWGDERVKKAESIFIPQLMQWRGVEVEFGGIFHLFTDSREAAGFGVKSVK